MDNINWDDLFNEQETHDHFRDLEGKDFYFAYGIDDRMDGYFIIVPKKFYDAHHHTFDQYIQDAVSHILPRGFFEDTEGIFSYDGDDVDGRRRLIKIGFVENGKINAD